MKMSRHDAKEDLVLNETPGVRALRQLRGLIADGTLPAGERLPTEQALAELLKVSRTTLRAPQSGTVTALSKEVGESVQGTGFMAGEVIMKVSDLQAMEVNLEVNESDIVRVHLGDDAEIEVDAFLSEVFTGRVSEIGNTALNALDNGFSMDQVTNFSVKVRLSESSYRHLLAAGDSTSSPFRPGMSATVDLLTAEVNGALSVPIQAVTTREGEDEADMGVFVVRGDSAVWTAIETGIQDSRHIEVKAGLAADEVVAVGPYEWVSRKLEDGMRVAVKVEE